MEAPAPDAFVKPPAGAFAKLSAVPDVLNRVGLTELRCVAVDVPIVLPSAAVAVATPSKGANGAEGAASSKIVSWPFTPASTARKRPSVMMGSADATRPTPIVSRIPRLSGINKPAHRDLLAVAC